MSGSSFAIPIFIKTPTTVLNYGINNCFGVQSMLTLLKRTLFLSWKFLLPLLILITLCLDCGFEDGKEQKIEWKKNVIFGSERNFNGK